MSRPSKKNGSTIEHRGADGIELPYIIVDDLYDDRDLQDPAAAELSSRWMFSRDLVKRARNAGGL